MADTGSAQRRLKEIIHWVLQPPQSLARPLPPRARQPPDRVLGLEAGPFLFLCCLFLAVAYLRLLLMTRAASSSALSSIASTLPGEGAGLHPPCPPHTTSPALANLWSMPPANNSSSNSNSTSTSSTSTSSNNAHRHAVLVGGSIRSMRECMEAQLQRLGYGAPGARLDLLVHLGSTSPVFVNNNAELALAWDATQLQWLSGLALRLVVEDLDWGAGGANLTLIPQDARAAIPSWPFKVQGPDNPILNVLANSYRRWRLLQMVEAEEAAGGFVYASITFLRPDLCPCDKDAIDLDALFPPPGQALPERGEPLKVFSAEAPKPAASSATPTPAPPAPPPAPARVLYTAASWGKGHHTRLLDSWVDDADALGGREAMAWYLSAFPFAEVLSGQRGVRFHPETLNRQALLYGLEQRAAQRNASQALHIFGMQQLRYCLMRFPGTHACDPGCALRNPD
jgi:hypothetical protein